VAALWRQCGIIGQTIGDACLSLLRVAELAVDAGSAGCINIVTGCSREWATLARRQASTTSASPAGQPTVEL
jgi:acyl-CoA reductase-like NAD-dependent aldehyde dehydrogenase